MTSGVCVDSDLSSVLQRSSVPSHHHSSHHGYSSQGQVSVPASVGLAAVDPGVHVLLSADPACVPDVQSGAHAGLHHGDGPLPLLLR